MRVVLLFCLVMTGSFGFAADPPPPPTTPPPPGLPIDGGLLVLAAISVMFGIYKIYHHTKKRTV